MEPTQPNSNPEPTPPLPAVPPTQPNLPPAPPTAQQPVVTPTGNPAPIGQPQSPIQPSFSAPPSKGSSKKVLLIIAIVVVVALLAGAGAYYFLNKEGVSSVADVANSVTGGNSDVTDRPDGTLDVSSLIDSQNTIKEQNLTAKLNQQVNLSDGLSFMVLSVERNFVSTNRYVKASAGKELVKVNMVVGNRDQDDTELMSSALFKIKNSAGGLLAAEIVNTEEVPDSLNRSEIAPGKQVKGSFIFEVDKDEKLQALVTDAEYKNYSTDATVTIKAEVTL